MTKAINIAVIGSHKVGKTTIYNRLERLLPPEIKCLNEIALERISDVNTFFSYMKMEEDILTQQINTLKWAKENEVNTFSDRSLIDNLACMIVGRESPYAYALSDDSKSSLEIIKVFSPIVSEAIVHFYDYDLLFYIPIEFKFGDPTEEQILYQQDVDNVIKHLLKVYGIKHHTVKGSVAERTKFIIEMTKQYMEAE